MFPKGGEMMTAREKIERRRRENTNYEHSESYSFNYDNFSEIISDIKGALFSLIIK